MWFERAKVSLLAVVRSERSLFSGVAGVGLLKVASTAAAILITVLLARALGPAQFGAYAFAFSTASLLTLPLLQGLPVLVVREVSRAAQDDRAAVSANLLAFANRLTAIVAMLLALVLLILLLTFPGRSELGQPLLLAVALALPLVMVATLVRGSVLRAHGAAVLGQVPDMVVRPLGFLLLVGALWWLPVDSAVKAMSLHLVGAVASLIVAWWLACGLAEPAAGVGSPERRVGQWTMALLPLSTVAGMQLINSQVDLVLLGFLGSPEDVGVYRVATTLALQVSFVLTVVNAVAAPKFARLYREGRIDELRRVNRLGAGVAFAVGALLFALYVLAGRQIISVSVGQAYLGAFIPLLVLSAAHLLTLWAGTTNVLLNMIGRERDVLTAAFLATAVNVSLNLILIPRIGILGAAVSSAGSLVAWRGVLSLYLRRRLSAPKGAS